MKSLLEELFYSRAIFWRRRSAYHWSRLFIIHAFRFIFRLIRIQSSLYKLYITTSVEGRHNCCYCQLWSIHFRLRMLTHSIRITLLDHFFYLTSDCSTGYKVIPFSFSFYPTLISGCQWIACVLSFLSTPFML
jgi:hypothetical protein